MNELKEIVCKLYDEYGTGSHYEVTKAEKTENGSWVIVVKKIEENNGGAENESNK